MYRPVVLSRSNGLRGTEMPVDHRGCLQGLMALSRWEVVETKRSMRILDLPDYKMVLTVADRNEGTICSCELKAIGREGGRGMKGAER